MAQPSNLMLKLSKRLFPEAPQQAAFVQALTQPQRFAPTILWTQPRPDPYPFECFAPLSGQPPWVDRLAAPTRPGQHPLHNAGAFYCLDYSSVFAASALLAIPQPLPWVLDLCASPGGKSLFAAVALKPDRLLCNEVIGKRLGMLIANLKRCQINTLAQDTWVLNRDPQVLATALPQMFSLVLVDAPCSGQSLIAKGEQAPGCFHPVNLNKNANRQKRILANAAQMVSPGGYLAYMTCTYAPEENEAVCDWLLDRFPHFHPLEVPHLRAFQSHLSAHPCYRLWPQTGWGAGSFVMIFRGQGGAGGSRGVRSGGVGEWDGVGQGAIARFPQA